MLLHHSQENYQVAAKRAADWAEGKLNALIEEGRRNTEATLAKIDNLTIVDHVVPASRVRFHADASKVRLCGIEEDGLELHPHALGQIVGRTNGTKKVTDWVYDADTAPEFASILNKKFQKLGKKRFLVRSVDDEIRGFMSDRYRRLDVRPLVTALVRTAVTDYDAVPLDAHMGATSFHMKLMLPTLYEPLENEIGAFGLTFRNSDFGAGRLYLKGFFNRLWCTNLAMCEDGISQVHLGGALTDDVKFSQRTYELDTRTMASALEDVVQHIFSPENIALRMMAIRDANEAGEKVNITNKLKRLTRGSRLLKGESVAVAEAYNGPDVELLPPGNSRWRLSNAISLIAQKAEPDRRLELETLAGEVAGLVKSGA